MQLLLTCFNEPEFHFKGKFYECPPPVEYRGYTLKDITMVPRPKHLPVEIWMPIASGKTIDMMAQLRPQGDGDAERRENPRRRACAPITPPATSTAGRSSSART